VRRRVIVGVMDKDKLGKPAPWNTDRVSIGIDDQLTRPDGQSLVHLLVRSPPGPAGMIRAHHLHSCAGSYSELCAEVFDQRPWRVELLEARLRQ